jgi:hypothetical protein
MEDIVIGLVPVVMTMPGSTSASPRSPGTAAESSTGTALSDRRDGDQASDKQDQKCQTRQGRAEHA